MKMSPTIAKWFVNREREIWLFCDILEGSSLKRLMMIHAEGGLGKSVRAAIGPILSYVTLVLVKGRYLVPAIRVLAMHLLNGMLFFLTVSLLTIGFYLGWTDGSGVTLLGAALFLPYVLLAPLVISTYLVRDAPGFAR